MSNLHNIVKQSGRLRMATTSNFNVVGIAYIIRKSKEERQNYSLV